MKKKLTFLTMALLSASTASAQILGDAPERILQEAKDYFYIIVVIVFIVTSAMQIAKTISSEERDWKPVIYGIIRFAAIALAIIGVVEFLSTLSL